MPKVVHIDALTYSNWHPVFHAGAFRNIRQNLDRFPKRLLDRYADADENLKAAIVGFGPSLKYSWPYLKHYDVIFTCSGAHDFLLEKGIKPTYHVECDPREHKKKLLNNPSTDVEYLMASCVEPQYLDKLPKENVTLWNLYTHPDYFIYPSTEDVIQGAGCVGIQTFWVAYRMGFRDFGVFGMDCSHDNGMTHASTHTNPKRGEDPCLIAIGPRDKDDKEGKWVKTNKIYTTEIGLTLYALEWKRTMMNQPDCRFAVLGFGLLPELLAYVSPHGNDQRNLMAVSESQVRKLESLNDGKELREGIQELSEFLNPKEEKGHAEQSPPPDDSVWESTERGWKRRRP